MPTTLADLEKAEEGLNFAERAYKQKLANMIALAKQVLAAKPEDGGYKPTNKGKG
jgi:hypothetical protein